MNFELHLLIQFLQKCVCKFSSYVIVKGCQHRVSDMSEWSMGGYADARFAIDEQGTSLRYDTGENGRWLL